MPCQLFFLNGTRAGSSIRIDPPSFSIGRDPRCDLAFDPGTDLTVSAHHAQVALTAVGYELTDTSSNGTFVNSKQVKRALLKDGDLLELGIGGPRLQFVFLASESQPEDPTVLSDFRESSQPRATQAVARPAVPGREVSQPRAQVPPTTPLVAAPPSSAATPAQASSPSPTPTKARVQVGVELERIGTGERHVFEKPVIRIGRDPSADVAYDPLTDLLVSYNHAKIMILDEEAVLFDTDSTNGTLVDDSPISRHELRTGHVIGLGVGGPALRVTVTRRRVGPLASVKTRAVPGGATVLGGITDLKDLSIGEAALLSEHPMADRLAIGRDRGNQIVLDSMYVSSRHALVERRGGIAHLIDAGSANGIYLSGQRIKEAPLIAGTEFLVGPYFLKYTGTSILVFDTRTKIWVDAHELTRLDPRTGRAFLDRVSLKIKPGEFVCILGPSGCGKSTLLKSLNGMVRAETGSVLMNNVDFYAHHEQLKHQVGYVPQDDIIHPQLTIWRTLQYAARLRLPPGTPTAKREERIRDVLSMLELYDHRQKPIHKLSGGQRKRVSIAVELLTDPAIIYLDEPTSGLDPNLEEKMMLILREMTLRGKTVASVTHTLDNIHLADKVTFLVDGKLAFFGTDEEARGYFSVARLPEVYKRFEERKTNTDSLRSDFEASPIFEAHVRSQLATPAQEGSTVPGVAATPALRRTGPGSLRQFWVLTSRYAEILTRDVKNTAILLLQAPLVALFIALAVRTDQTDRGPTSTMMLILSLSALWFGCSNAAREVTKEASIFARERMVNLRVLPYVASKFFVLQWLALVQVATMLFMVHLLRSGYVLAEPPPGCARWGIRACSALILPGVPGELWLQLLNLYLTALNGIGLGLLISTLAGNSDKAMSLVPLVLIPQVLFSGSFGIPQPGELVKRAVGYTMSLNWSLDQAKRLAMCTPEEERPPGRPGDGCARCLHAWDPFKHRLLKTEAQDDDGKCRSVLPVLGQMTDFPESLQVVEDGLYTPPSAHGKGAARDATPSTIGLYVLGGYTALLFALVCIFLKRKDRAQK
jgi:ABC transport system ATP-binding/permease protein